MPRTLEADLERHCLDLLKGEGYRHFSGDTFDPDPTDSTLRENRERSSFHEVALASRFRAAVARLNPLAPPEAVERTANALLDQEFPEVLAENRRIHRLLVDGVPIEYQRGAETIHDRLRLVDWTNGQNEWLVVDQYTVVGASRRRPDLVLFLNGLPLVVIELKAAETETATTQSAYNQLQTYKRDIPGLFRTNLLGVISDGLSARYGTISADYDRFMAWRTVDGEQLESPTGSLAIETLIRGLLRPEVLVNMLRFFTVFEDDGATTTKKVAGYHQYHAAMKGLRSTKAAMAKTGKGGVVWHTQGSGKSLLMAFFGGLLVHDPELGNPTLLVLTDRNDLDTQLHGTFSRCKELFGQDPEQVEKVTDLRARLDRQVGGVVFATIQKFRPDEVGEFSQLTNRKNVVVFVDEAHRSQYGFAAKMDVATGAKSYGFAHYVRKGLPNATFIGFTGTPVELVDKNTKDVFGDYIDIYDIARAVEDKATVPIHYEGKIVRLNLDENDAQLLNEEFDELTDDLEEDDRTHYGQKWSKLEALAGAERRLDELANLVVEHFERRQGATIGKGMVVCMSRRICVELYDRIAKLRPNWHETSDDRGAMKVVMTGSAADPEVMQPHVRSKAGLELLARRFRNPKDDFRLVIVRDMWLTGFDSPSMHTLYVDKPMKGHNLMQAIARVNRIFRDKPAGLVVDTIGIATELKAALSFYSAADRDLTGVDIVQAVGALQDALCVMRTLFHGFDYRVALSGTPADRLRLFPAAVEHVLSLVGSTTEDRKAGRKRFMDAVTKLEKAFKLASSTPEAQQSKDEVAFFCGVRTALRKLEDDGPKGMRAFDRDVAIQRLVNQAVASTEVVDILTAAGIKSPDISVLSDEFLSEMQRMPQKNLAAEALRKLLQDQISVRTRTNVVRHRQFSERLSEAMAKYHNRVIDALQIIMELIQIGKDLRNEPLDTLSPEERAFYDALAENESACQIMGNEQLRVIAAELVQHIRTNASVDWWRFEQRRAQIRVTVRRILRRHGYPPDLQASAIKTVVEQAEAMATELAGREAVA